MQKIFIGSGALFAAIAVIAGAFGAHALKEKITPDHLQVFETAVKYMFYHALALLLIVSFYDKLSVKLLNATGICFITGIILFSGSLFLLSTMSINGMEGWKKIVGPVTPLGGLSFITGWILLLFAAINIKPAV
jgi:uncharacterized membrane protein YgdD (TMEM256/DUF423 family)